MSWRPDWCGHAIGRNHACQRPSRFVFVSVETRQIDVKGKQPYTRHELLKGAACYVSWKKGRQPREQWHEFASSEEFWVWMAGQQSAKSVLWVVSSNALFDFTILGLWSRIECKHYAVDRPGKSYNDPRTGKDVVSKTWAGLLAIDGRPFHVETQGDVGRVNFTDLGNYYPSTIADIERMVSNAGAEMGPDQGDVGAVPSKARHVAEIMRRAYLGLVKQWESEDNGNWKLSAAGLAWSNYRHKHMPTAIRVHRHSEARDLEWKSYFGGEVRCYYRGATNCTIAHYDVNSLYPYVMREFDFPTELVDYILTPKPGIVDHLLSRFAVIADVTLEADKDDFPHRHKQGIVYPIGVYRTALCGPELYRAVQSGCVRDYHAIAYYLRGKLFDGYVDHWYNAKRCATEAGDRASTQFCKLMLNSLQGKFAQRSPVWETDPKIDVIRPWKTFPWNAPDTKCLYNARSIGWLGQKMVSRNDKQHAFPAISAYITAYARCYMRRFRNSIPPSVVFYQDTDSLMLDASYDVTVGDNPLPINNDLGGFRKVATYSGVTFRGPKNYSTKDKRVIAGIKTSDLAIGAGHYIGNRVESTAAIVSREPDCTIREYQKHLDCPGTCNEGGYLDSGWSYPLIISQI